MSENVKKILLILSMSGLAMAATGCKKVDDTSKDAMSSGSSGVMSNSAGLSGTPGTSDAARRASDAAPASSPAAASSELAVKTTPDAAASGASSVQ
ncbi:hypothetical protein [Paraburkholderia aspalathi]|uniref:hypothetical protein n=1 Tax=Paraburkholderia aspalathi TaxID=1324617 RepID=UPI000B816D89|nr:hypothetical protein [Paraburkholderia aspalathi]